MPAAAARLRQTSEQILEKLAPAMLTPIANMAAERAGTAGTNPFREIDSKRLEPTGIGHCRAAETPLPVRLAPPLRKPS